MIPFRPILLSDRAAIGRLLQWSRAPICDHTFANLYAWQQTYRTSWAEVEGRLVVRFMVESGDYTYMIVGGGEAFDRIMPRLKAEAEHQRQPLRMVCLSSEDVEQFRRWLRNTDEKEESYAFCDNRDYSDYIYSVEELCALRGRRFQPKRNHVNRFESQYDYRFEPLRREHFEECLKLECLWQRRKGDLEDCRESDEQMAIRRVLEAYEELDMLGGVILIEDHVAAFTFGSAIDSETFCTHVEKADAAYEGIFPMINRCFAMMLRDRGFRWVNREEDMGLAGLRRSKLSYHPHHLQEKMSIKQLSPVEVGCRRLWMEVFGDERTIVDLFLTEVSRPENTFVHIEQEEVVAMLHLVELQTSYGRTAYLYAIATSPEWRSRALASTLIDEALEAARQRGYDVAMLIPADEDLVGFYARFGFDGPTYKMDFSEGFDLGTGNPEQDIAMVMKL